MNQFVSELRKEVNEFRLVNEKQSVNLLSRFQDGILLMEDVFQRLKSFILNYSFKNKEEEISFFKKIKPGLLSHLIFYQEAYNIEMNRPEGGNEAQREYFRGELERIEGYFRKNREFYHYYRSGNTYMDEMFFLRSSKPELHLHLETFHFERDMTFSTNCDYKVSKILANSLVESYINGELDILENRGTNITKTSFSNNFKSGLIWTGSKIDLLEIAYAIDTAQCINYGRTQLKQIVELFENIFNIDLEGNLSRAFYDLRIRKDRTSFLNKLTYLLCERMDKADN